MYGRGVSQAKEVGAATDGADWLQGFIDLHRPDAVRILEFPHAAEHVSAIADALQQAGCPLLKGAGIHWAPAHVNPMLALLRTAFCNDRGDEAWQATVTERCRQRQECRCQQATPRLTCLVVSVLVLLYRFRSPSPKPLHPTV